MTETLKTFYLTELDPTTGERYELDFMARAEHPNDVIAAWARDSGGDPARIEAVEAVEGDVIDYLTRIGPIETVRAVTRLYDRAQAAIFAHATVANGYFGDPLRVGLALIDGRILIVADGIGCYPAPQSVRLPGTIAGPCADAAEGLHRIAHGQCGDDYFRDVTPV